MIALRRRREPRIHQRLRVAFGSASDPFVGFTTDVSASGLFVASTHNPATHGIEVLLEVELPSHERVDLPARIRWIRESPLALTSILKRGFGVVLASPPGPWKVFVAALDHEKHGHG